MSTWAVFPVLLCTIRNADPHDKRHGKHLIRSTSKSLAKLAAGRRGCDSGSKRKRLTPPLPACRYVARAAGGAFLWQYKTRTARDSYNLCEQRRDLARDALSSCLPTAHRTTGPRTADASKQIAGMPLPDKETLKRQIAAGGGRGGDVPIPPLLPGEWKPGMPCHWTEQTRGMYLKCIAIRISLALNFAAGIAYLVFRGMDTIGKFTRHPALIGYQIFFF
eukprot:IDg12233t1